METESTRNEVHVAAIYKHLGTKLAQHCHLEHEINHRLAQRAESSAGQFSTTPESSHGSTTTAWEQLPNHVTGDAQTNSTFRDATRPAANRMTSAYAIVRTSEAANRVLYMRCKGPG